MRTTERVFRDADLLLFVEDDVVPLGELRISLVILKEASNSFRESAEYRRGSAYCTSSEKNAAARS